MLRNIQETPRLKVFDKHGFLRNKENHDRDKLLSGTNKIRYLNNTVNKLRKLNIKILLLMYVNNGMLSILAAGEVSCGLSTNKKTLLFSARNMQI